MNRAPGPLLVIGVCTAVLYFGALVALSPRAFDSGSSPDTASEGRAGRPQNGASKTVGAPLSAQSGSSSVGDADARMASTPGRGSGAAPPSGDSGALSPQTRSPRATPPSFSGTDSGSAAPPSEVRAGPGGQTYVLRNYTAAETEAERRADGLAREATISQARADPAAFAARHHLELEDLQAMLDGKQPFPDRLVAERRSRP